MQKFRILCHHLDHQVVRAGATDWLLETEKRGEYVTYYNRGLTEKGCFRNEVSKTSRVGCHMEMVGI